MDGQRLVKVLLPAQVVTRMDRYITSSAAYQGRGDFIADAVDAFLADLEQLTYEAEGRQLTIPRTITRTEAKSPTKPGLPAEAVAVERPRDHVVAATLAEVTRFADIPTRPAKVADGEPTWGLHNRDFPTIWAAALLGRKVETEGGPVDMPSFTNSVVNLAAQIGEDLPKAEYDTSGFPTNPAKRDRSQGRFLSFFVGDEAGRGPLFTLGLAALTGQGKATLTTEGAATLHQLAGLSCRRDQPPRREHAVAFLAHLARLVPADFALLEGVCQMIADGLSDRVALIDAVAAEHPGWSSSVASTNTAGFIARAREWGLVSDKQVDRRYTLTAEWAETLAAARAAAQLTANA